MAGVPTIDEAFGVAPQAPPPLLPNSPLKRQVTAYPQGMVRPGKENPNDRVIYPNGVEGIGSVEVNEDGTPMEVLTIGRENGRDLTREEMGQKIREGHDFGAFQDPESADAFSKAAFGSTHPEAVAKVPLVDDVFGAADDSWVRRTDQQLQQSMANIFNAFGYSGYEGFGREPIATPQTSLSPETEAWMKRNGFFNDYAKGQHAFTAAIFEGLFKTSASALALLERSGYAALAAPLGALDQTIKELGITAPGNKLASIVQDPQLGPLVNPAFNLPLIRPAAEMAGVSGLALRARAAAGRAANLNNDLSALRANGGLAEGEAGFYGAKPVSPENAEARVAAAQQAGIPTPTPEPAAPDVQTLARRIAPDEISRYEALETEKAQARAVIAQGARTRATSPEALEAQAEIDRLSGVRPPTPPEAVQPIDEDQMTNIFLRPQPEEVPQPTLPAPPEGAVTSLPVIERGAQAALNAQRNQITRELRLLPRGGQQAVDRLARLEAVERNLKEEDLTPAARRTLMTRRDELLTDTTPEKLQTEAAPIARRRVLLAQREEVERKLDELSRRPITEESPLAKELEQAPEAGAAARLEAAQGRLRSIMETLTPEEEEARASLQRAQIEQMNLLPNVLSAYQQAREMMPDTGPAVAKAVEDVSAGKTDFVLQPGDKGAMFNAGLSGRGPMTPGEEATAIAERGLPAIEGASKARTTTNIRPIEGTGATQVRTLSEGVEAQAIENDLIDTFGDLPIYQQVSMKEQARLAAAYVMDKPEDAKAVAMGLKAPPRDILPESIFVAVEKKAIAEGDVETLRQLATESKLTTAATTMGQRIRTLAERDTLSPVDAIQEVQDARRAALEARDAKAIDETVDEIRDEVKKAAPTKGQWESFIESILCEE